MIMENTTTNNNNNNNNNNKNNNNVITIRIDGNFENGVTMYMYHGLPTTPTPTPRKP